MNDPREIFLWLTQHIPATSKVVTDSYRVGGQRIDISCFSPEIARALLAPFGHLKSPAADEAILQIVSWYELDFEKAPVKPTHPRSKEECVLSSDGRYALYSSYESFQVLDRNDEVILAAIRELSQEGSVQRAEPFVYPLSVWLNDNDLLVCQAAMVAFKTKGVLIAGAEGAGKSTVAHTCAKAGWNVVGDDKIAIQASKEAWVGHSIYSTIKMKNRTPKEIVDVTQHFPGQATKSAEIKSIVTVQYVPSQKTAVLAKATPAETLKALAPTSATMSSTVAKSSVPFLKKLISSVPCYVLTCGNEKDLPKLIEKALGKIQKTKKSPTRSSKKKKVGRKKR